MITEILSSIFQVIVFALIPFLVYLIRYKQLKGFLQYIGLTPSPRKALLWALLIALWLAIPILAITQIDPDFKDILTHPESVTGKIRAMGWGPAAVLTILFTAILETALAEEIFFRGFVAKRLIAISSFQTGNLIQALLFGLIHTLLFLTITDNYFFLAIIFLFPGLGAYAKVYLNEKLAAGSILPGWVAHATGNLISYTYVGFFL